MTRRLEGWIFDAYPEPEGMRVWVIDGRGEHHDFLDAWSPCFYISGGKAELAAALSFLRGRPFPVSVRPVERRELFSGRVLAVLKVRVPSPAYAKLAEPLRQAGVSLFDADIHPVQAYHYERGHFPLARCAFEVEGSRLRGWELRDDPWAIDYELPPLRVAHLALAGSGAAGVVDPNHRPRGMLVLSQEGRAYELEGGMDEQLESLARHLQAWDPDVITTDWGDSFLLPQLDALAGGAGRQLPWSRDRGRSMAGRAQRSFYTYGRTIYQGGAKYLFGRWHLDLKNSFMLRETGLDGLFEIARIAKIPVQRAARCTIGTALSSMQMDWAQRHEVLIPMDKAQAEDFRPAGDLLSADKGGLAYEPDAGWHEAVAEYDFTSMYPEMMVRHNISPETVNCPCCPDNLVPEAGHHLCRQRRGLAPSVLAPILRKRARYKALAKAGGPGAGAYKKRADAHKWCLVCCFGYLGFKNARFGKIESHECVTAWGREILLRAKESVEKRGFHMLHALVDALWIKVAPGTDLEGLRLSIEKEAGCPLALDGVYKWLRFCPSKVDSLSGVPGRYFGAFSNGELKIRGLACRRHDTPKLLKSLQDELLRLLAAADDLAGCRALGPALLLIVDEYRQRLKDGRVTADELAITFNLSQLPEEYARDTVQALAAKQLAEAGVALHPGEAVRYVITAAHDKVKDWRAKPLALMDGPLEYDVGRYLELLERAADEILDGLAAPRPQEMKKRSVDTRQPELPLAW
ncbi:MAG: DNA polymerase domain-containing protein [Elusimicrobia bacterium]|nr:DNA polymerase domain-containing protein [Elusimicrobiota bacterium]